MCAHICEYGLCFFKRIMFFFQEKCAGASSDVSLSVLNKALDIGTNIWYGQGQG